MSILSSISATVTDIHIPPAEKDSSANNHKQASPKATALQRRYDKPTLLIQSYNRHTPPDPQPDLEYDCRATKNPLRKTRLSHTGLDDELQDELMDRTDFSDLVSDAEVEIRKLMEVKDARAKGEDEVAVVRVGCLCGSGHHRSPAFAEQLGKIDWPKDWDVRTEHRDLTHVVEEEKRAYLEKDQKKEEKLHKEESENNTL
jgi:RNase adaptor protein for sRNA GlmZ degradation